MEMVRLSLRWIGALALLTGFSSAYAANPTVEDLLKLKPKQDGVVISTPSSEAEIAACKVEVIKGENGGSGYLLRDGTGRPLRRFFDTNGDRYIDVWSYYLDGHEVYREIDSNFNKKVDIYRWFGPGGMKIGLDLNEDGKIDRWEAISPEEVSQEVLQAVINRDIERLQALMVTDADLKSLELPAAEVARIKEKLSHATEKFNNTTASLIKLGTKTHWIHLETAAPQCVAADAFGGSNDLIRYKAGTILYENEGKHDFLQTGELILVGRAWKIVEAPVSGYAAPEEAKSEEAKGGIVLDAKTKPIVDELRKIDEAAPRSGSEPSAIVRYNLARAAVLAKLAEVTSGEQQENWVRQLADCLSAAAQNSPSSDKSSYDRLVALREQIAKSGSQRLTGYVAYREISTEYTAKLAKGVEIPKVQDEWREKLKKFVETYPSAEDAPDAVLQLGMVSEFVGKETEAKNWYDKLAREYPASPIAAKAKGASKRLDAEGKFLELASPELGTGRNFDIQQMGGKVVVVYYWASWNGQSIADFAKLKSLQQSFGSKGLELVLVNLDNSQNDAVNFLQRNSLNGIHLHQPGALDSPLAVHYGVMVLPNLFLVGKEGKVVSRSVQVGGLEEEIKKMLN